MIIFWNLVNQLNERHVFDKSRDKERLSYRQYDVCKNRRWSNLISKYKKDTVWTENQRFF